MPPDEGAKADPADETVRQMQERLAAASLNPTDGILREILTIVRGLEVVLGEVKRYLGTA